MFGCGAILPGQQFSPDKSPGEKMSQETNELKGAHYAKLNSIGCRTYEDMRMVVSSHNDFETVDKLIRDKHCFVLPTDTDIFIKDRVDGDIVSVKYRGSRELFYTVRSSLGSE
jgi:hypothetical protein